MPLAVKWMSLFVLVLYSNKNVFDTKIYSWDSQQTASVTRSVDSIYFYKIFGNKTGILMKKFSI